jgi:hypothetical protein
MQIRTPVYVALLDEGTDCWRLTSAITQADGRLVLSDENYNPASERWAVSPGSEIDVVEERIGDRVIAVANSKQDSAR